MKRMTALLCALFFLLVSGCGNAPAPENPDAAVQPGTLPAERFFALVSSYLSDGETPLTVSKDDGDAFLVPLSETEKQTLYLLELGDLELAVFADEKSDGVLGAYVRMLYDDASAEADLFTLTAACLRALEPQHYEVMLTEAAAGSEASGDVWAIYPGGEIMNLLPKEAN